METQQLHEVLAETLSIDHPDNSNKAANQYSQDILLRNKIESLNIEYSIDEWHFKGSNEEQLIQHTILLNTGLQMSLVITYWHIGNNINLFYNKEYGKNELQRIADATGIGRDTLTKACKLAKKYSQEQIEILLNGSFQVSWFYIANNLRIPADNFIDLYRNANDRVEFNHNIINFKDSLDIGGRSNKRQLTSGENNSNMATTGPVENSDEPNSEQVSIDGDSDMPDVIDNREQDTVNTENVARIQELEIEVERLADVIKGKDLQIKSLQDQLIENDRIIEKQEDQIISLREYIDGIRQMLESEMPVRSILGHLEDMSL